MKTKTLLLVIFVSLSLLFTFNLKVNSAEIMDNYIVLEIKQSMDHEVWVFENGEWWIYVYSEDGGIIKIYQPPND